MVLETQKYTGPVLDGLLFDNNHSVTSLAGIDQGPPNHWYYLAGNHTTKVSPLTGHSYLTSAFWSKENFRMVPWPGTGTILGPHGGVDLHQGAFGTLIRAAKGGLVVFSDWNSGYGWAVIIRHDEFSVPVYTGYYHMRTRPRVTFGQTINNGHVLGEVGDTGTYATGAHLHWGAWVGNSNPMHTSVRKYFDPLPYASYSFYTVVPTTGYTLTQFNGTIEQLKVTGVRLGVDTFSAAVNGQWLQYVPGAPDFVNTDFVNHYPGEFLNNVPLVAVV